MTAALEGAVELLERALGYTRVTLADVGPHNLEAPTPCSGWSLARLLVHMEDALDAFTEAAQGHVRVEPASTSGDRVEVLREKACALLGAWAEHRPASVDVGDRHLDAAVLVTAAALEITVHGWDVAQSTGSGTPIPDDLARGLQPVAERLVRPADRGSRFAAARHLSTPMGSSDTLIAFLGRRTGPVGGNRSDTPSRGGIAS